MNITLKSTNRVQLANDCLKHRIYARNGYLKDVLTYVASGVSRDRLIVAYDDQQPIGVIFTRGNAVMLYVKKAYRQKRVGTTLLNTLILRYRRRRKSLLAWPGDNRGKRFFKKNDIATVHGKSFLEQLGFVVHFSTPEATVRLRRQLPNKADEKEIIDRIVGLIQTANTIQPENNVAVTS